MNKKVSMSARAHKGPQRGCLVVWLFVWLFGWLVWFVCGLVRFGLVWLCLFVFGLVWFGLI